MKPLKVYMFVYLFPPEFTGASIQALTLAKMMRKNGIDITFVTATPERCKIYKKSYDGFPIIRLSTPKENNNLSLFIYWLKIFYILVTEYRKYQIIHSIGIFTEHNILSIYGKILNKKTLVKTTLSNEISFLLNGNHRGRENKFNLFALNKYDKIVGISKDIVTSLNNTTIEKRKIIYIPNGVDLKKFRTEQNPEFKTRLRKRFNLPDRGIIYSYIGALHKRKKIDFMIEHWLNVFRKETGAYLLIAGPTARETMVADGGGKDYANYLRKTVENGNGKDKVFFRPFRNEVEDYFKASDFFINASASEGLSNSLLEAMACGVIPVISKTSGSADVVVDGCNGYLFKIDDPESFISALKLCWRNCDKKMKMSKAAQMTISNKYSINMTCSQYISLYNNLITKIKIPK